MKRIVLAFTLSLFVFTGTLTIGNASAETIKVGAILAVTGPASFLGGPEARTLEMLVDEANESGGINGNKIELIIKDSGANPEKAISFAKQLIEEEKVVAVIGPSTSGETMKVKKIFEEGATPLLSCAAAEVIVNPVAKYVFKTPQKDSYAAEKIFQTMKDMGISKIAVLAGNTGDPEQITHIHPFEDRFWIDTTPFSQFAATFWQTSRSQQLIGSLNAGLVQGSGITWSDSLNLPYVLCHDRGPLLTS